MKIIASDFDNTIYLEDDFNQTKDNIEAIRHFIAQGNIFCIITGRNYTDLKQELNKENIPYSYLICEDGAKIFNNMDYCIHTTLLEKEEIEKIIPVLEENHYDYYLDDGYNETNNYEDCVKIVVNCSDGEEQKKIVETIKEQCYVHIYASRYHVNIIHKTVNKEKALYQLFELEKLDLELLHVIGDNDNDYEMIKQFHGGIMKNHHPILDSLHKREYNSIKDFIEELMGY